LRAARPPRFASRCRLRSFFLSRFIVGLLKDVLFQLRIELPHPLLLPIHFDKKHVPAAKHVRQHLLGLGDFLRLALVEREREVASAAVEHVKKSGLVHVKRFHAFPSRYITVIIATCDATASPPPCTSPPRAAA